jgi:hypothetical protein
MRMKVEKGGNGMCKRMILVLFIFTLGLLPARGEERPAIVVNAFTIAPDVKFPYDMFEMQKAAIAEMKAKDAAQFDIIEAAAPGQARVFVLDGVVLEWHPGNVAERMLIAAGSVAGRENAKIHFWLTSKDGKKVFETTETIRQLWMRNLHEKNSGLLRQPFADKITQCLAAANLDHENAPAK